MPNERQPTVPQNPIVHMPVAQSVGAAQTLKSGQRAQVVAPPQSMSVSPWFWMPSLQLAAAHRLPAPQTPVMQSLPVRQATPTAHFAHSAPPQSMSDSVPLMVMSVQFAATHALLAQIRLAQSVSALQRRPLAQAVHTVPPQSTSVSSPFNSRVAARDAHVGHGSGC